MNVGEERSFYMNVSVNLHDWGQREQGEVIHEARVVGRRPHIRDEVALNPFKHQIQTVNVQEVAVILDVKRLIDKGGANEVVHFVLVWRVGFHGEEGHHDRKVEEVPKQVHLAEPLLGVPPNGIKKKKAKMRRKKRRKKRRKEERKKNLLELCRESHEIEVNCHWELHQLALS